MCSFQHLWQFWFEFDLLIILFIMSYIFLFLWISSNFNYIPDNMVYNYISIYKVYKYKDLYKYTMLRPGCFVYLKISLNFIVGYNYLEIVWSFCILPLWWLWSNDQSKANYFLSWDNTFLSNLPNAPWIVRFSSLMGLGTCPGLYEWLWLLPKLLSSGLLPFYGG